MIKSVKLRLAIVLATIVLALIYLFPTMGGTMPDWWGKVFPTEKIHLGLDLQGGIHLLMEVDVEKAMHASTDRMTASVKRMLLEEKIKVSEVTQVKTGSIKFSLEDANDLERLQAFLEERVPAWNHMSTQGSIVLYRVSDKDQQRIEKLALDQAVETMRNRIDQFGVAEPEIRVQANNRILVQLPGVKDTRRAIDLIGKTALLEFKLVNDQFDPTKVSVAELGENLEILYEQTRDPETNVIVSKRPYVLEKKSLMTGEYIANANVRFNSQFGEPYVSLEFNSQGAKLFDQITAASVKRRLAIILDNNVYSAPVIQEQISGGQAQVSGRFTAKEAHDLAIVLRAGALPAPIKILEQRTVGPSLGRDSIRNGFISMIVGFLLVIVFMVVYYRLSGLVANLALVLNLLFIMSILALAQATLTLPGIAGIVLTIGMAVDANVLIFERIREELRFGKTPRAGLESGYGKAFLTIMDANITTLIAAIVLYQYGTGPIKGFAVTLSLGIISSLYTAIFVTRLVFDMVAERRPLKKLKYLTTLESYFMQFLNSDKMNVDFIGKRRLFMMISAVAILIGLASLLVRGGLNYGIDFAGGTMVQVRFAKAVDSDAVRQALAAIDMGDASIQQFEGDEAHEFLIRVEKSTSDLVGLSDEIKVVLDKVFGSENVDIRRVEMVGPKVGKDLRHQGMLAIIYALIGILIYVTVRFEFRFAVGAIVALTHDVLITVGVFALLNKEFSLPILAALLAIVGYSLNDTIVVYDRIRENMKGTGKANFVNIVNASINQTLSRTILTSLTTLLVLISLFVLGGGVIHDFAFAMIVGVMVGTYSSIFVASPVVISMQPKKK